MGKLENLVHFFGNFVLESRTQFKIFHVLRDVGEKTHQNDSPPPPQTFAHSIQLNNIIDRTKLTKSNLKQIS